VGLTQAHGTPQGKMVGRYMIIIGLLVAALGALMTFAPRFPLIGRLPGDIFIRRDNFLIFIPIATSVVISIVLTVILYLAGRR